jgi:hypothetical protein
MQLLKRTLLTRKVKSALMPSLYDGIHGSTIVSLSFVPEISASLADLQIFVLKLLIIITNKAKTRTFR